MISEIGDRINQFVMLSYQVQTKKAGEQISEQIRKLSHERDRLIARRINRR